VKIDSQDEFHYLTVDLVYTKFIDSIGLVPVMTPLSQVPTTYGFPKRFKVEVLQGTAELIDGEWVGGPDQTEWETVANWLDEDFPDPGPYPVVFSEINRNVSKLRIAVPAHSGQDFYALGELYMFRIENGELADNVATFGETGVLFESSGSLALEGDWELGYVHDGISILGLPLSEEESDVEDLILEFGKGGSAEGPVQIVLDLGKVQPIGRIEIWPTVAPDEMAIPLFGFPGSVSVELSTKHDFSDGKRIDVLDVRSRMQNDNLLTVIGEGEKYRYIRLTFEDLFEFAGESILGLGEISVMEFGKVFSLGCEVSSTGVPPNYADQLPLLVDGFSRGRTILPEANWIMGLAKRRPLDVRLSQVEQTLDIERRKWNSLQNRLGIYGGVFLVIVALSGWGLQRRHRRRDLDRLKLQITRDLHDEVGSSLGSISLVSDQLEAMAPDEEIREELSEVSLMAREANASLLEVVWMTDKTTILLSELITKLVERAEKVLRKVKIVSKITPDIPDIKVRLTAKRHLISFFKEAVHNCARHAMATQVLISVDVRDETFSLAIQDNGCGFDPGKPHDGWGLGSMKKRVEELGGDLSIVTAIDEGTSLRLEIPLRNLSTDPTHPYKTSN
jgi:signal transduction histidine kinase